MRIDIRKLLSAGIILSFLQTLFQPTLNAQSTNNSPAYFPSNYSEQPIITFKEVFLNKITYYVDGEKSGSQEVALLLESGLDGRSNFTSYQRKKIMGTAMNFTGLAVNLGFFAYLFTMKSPPIAFPTMAFAYAGGWSIARFRRHTAH